MDVVDRSNRPDVLGGLNPSLRVPTLVLDDGSPLAESNAILWYLGDGTRFVPDDRYLRKSFRLMPGVAGGVCGARFVEARTASLAVRFLMPCSVLKCHFTHTRSPISLIRL